MENYAIRTAGLSFDYGSNRALDGLSLEIPRGIVFGFLGPNGSGKTTTIHLLLGLLEPESGTAEVLGFDTRSEADLIRQHSGALLEHTGLYERLSAEDNLMFFGRINRLGPDECQERIQELLIHFNLWERRQERVGTWSRGMKQKLAIARALLHQPEIIFLDEPTAGLDPAAAAALREDLQRLVEETRVTVFLNTHNLFEAEKMCSLLGVIRQGQLLTVGHPEQLRAGKDANRHHIAGSGFTPTVLEMLRAHPLVESVSQQNGNLALKLSQPGGISRLVSLLVTQGAHVEEVRQESPDLEDVFLKLIEDESNVE